MKRILALLLLTGLPAVADISLNPYVFNPGFEVPTTSCCNFPTGWFQGGTAVGDAGNWNPSDFPSANLGALGGQQVAYINNYSGAHPTEQQLGPSLPGGSPELNYWYLAQTLNITGGMIEGDTYSLTYGVAIRKDIAAPTYFRVQINGNYNPTNCPQCDAITRGSTESFVPGQWYFNTVSYTAQAADAGFEHPTIYLVNDGSTDGKPVLTQAEFDVPEPAGIFLLGLQFGSVALLVLAFRKVPART